MDLKYGMLAFFCVVMNAVSFSQEWELINPLPTYESIEGVAVVSDSLVYICGCGPVMFKTTDGGQNWEALTLPTQEHLWDLYFFGPDTGFVVGNVSTILRTTDGGASWEAYPQLVPTDLFNVYFADREHGYIGGSYHTVIKTGDGGDTWKVMSHSLSVNQTWSDFKFSDPDTGYAVGTHDIFWGDSAFFRKTFDGGETWTQINIPGEIEFIESLELLDNGDIWFGSGNAVFNGIKGVSRLYHSVDGGQSWQFVDIEIGSGILDVQFISNDTGFVLNDHFVSRTTDGGLTWMPDTSNPHNQHLTGPRDMDWLDPVTGIVGGRNGSIYRSDNGAVTWEELFEDIGGPFFDVFFLDEMNGYIAGDGLLRSDDGGYSWTMAEPFPGYSGTFLSISFAGQDKGWLTGTVDSLNLFHTTDGGQGWIPVETPVHQGLGELFVLNADAVWACGEDSLIRTYDGGMSWEKFDYLVDGFLADELVFVDENHGFLSMFSSSVPGDGKLFSTSDGGGTWLELMYGTSSGRIRAMDFKDKDHGMISLREEGVLRTSDGGGTWTVLGPIGGEDPDHLEYLDETDVLAACADKMVATSRDEGGSWDLVYYTNASPSPANQTFFLVENRGWMVGTRGIIMKYTGTPVNVPETANGLHLLKVYPNPAGAFVSVSGAGRDIRLHVYDINGKRVMTRQIDDGGKVFTDGLIPGMYTFVFYSGNDRVVRKVVKY